MTQIMAVKKTAAAEHTLWTMLVNFPTPQRSKKGQLRQIPGNSETWVCTSWVENTTVYPGMTTYKKMKTRKYFPGKKWGNCPLHLL